MLYLYSHSRLLCLLNAHLFPLHFDSKYGETSDLFFVLGKKKDHLLTYASTILLLPHAVINSIPDFLYSLKTYCS
jgi:hypothetical protein